MDDSWKVITVLGYHWVHVPKWGNSFISKYIDVPSIPIRRIYMFITPFQSIYNTVIPNWLEKAVF